MIARTSPEATTRTTKRTLVIASHAAEQAAVAGDDTKPPITIAMFRAHLADHARGSGRGQTGTAVTTMLST